ncbi:hypothetical protein WN51_14689 [Melipona quadrifasciata]|uniref:Uncharacterized protein n=1 Tax=Melipona quadrifasciata TaxID=166423 RepID=A0A0N0U5F4_9HYME|nr:hypothetical protein WN51_14689 [Melipona quadrifasciata]
MSELKLIKRGQPSVLQKDILKSKISETPYGALKTKRRKTSLDAIRAKGKVDQGNELEESRKLAIVSRVLRIGIIIENLCHWWPSVYNAFQSEIIRRNEAVNEQRKEKDSKSDGQDKLKTNSGDGEMNSVKINSESVVNNESENDDLNEFIETGGSDEE